MSSPLVLEVIQLSLEVGVEDADDALKIFSEYSVLGWIGEHGTNKVGLSSEFVDILGGDKEFLGVLVANLSTLPLTEIV